MKIAALYNPLTVSGQVWESLAEISQRLTTNEVGSAAIFDHGRLVGIITERDLVRASADRVDFDETPVADYMTEEPAVVTPDTSAREAAMTMLELGIRHLPVVIGTRLVGVVSIRDVLRDMFWTAQVV